ncbi:nucleotide-diphospho-sugar transferase [Lichtheimia hyalospora FSU 10163]|nr:nucleotide-diphospho-sugar transferase [Lichtheimia hyalospora FSU 10163]
MVSKTVPKAAWVVVLTSTNNYIKGVIALAQALRMTRSIYPLVVLYTSAVTKRAVKLLKDSGCQVQSINPIHPPGKTRYVFERFVETWTKLAVWNLEEYERVVLLDADMLVLQNMDELMDISLPDEHHIAACHACTCNPQKIKTYPADWIPANCAYTNSANKIDYFNSGMIVLKPSRSKFQEITLRLYRIPDLTSYRFPDQDFLNEIFEHRWIHLPYIYNSLKTLSVAHPTMWDFHKVKNIHYILSNKPWDDYVDDERYMAQYRLWRDVYTEAINHANLSSSDILSALSTTQ